MPPKITEPVWQGHPNGEKNLKLYNNIREIGEALDLTTLRVMMTYLSYSKFLTPVVMMWKMLYSSKELKILHHWEKKSFFAKHNET